MADENTLILGRKNTAVAKKLRGYDPDTALRICELVASGKTMREVVAMDDMPSQATLYRWLVAYPKFHDAFEQARELSAQSFEDEALDMARTLKGKNDFTGTKVRAYEVAMGQLRWSAARRDPKRYGQRPDAGGGMNIQINTSLNLDAAANAAGNMVTVEGKVLPSTPETDASASIYSFTAEPIPVEAEEIPAERDPAVDDGAAEPAEPTGSPFDVGTKADRAFKAKIGRPRGTRKGHKTPAQTRATIGAYARRKKNAESKE